MIVRDTRTNLDRALGNTEFTVLLLSGTRGSKAGEIHTKIVAEELQPWRKYFLISDLSILTTPEKTRWFGGSNVDRYAVVGGDGEPRAVAESGPVTELLRADKTPSMLKIRRACAKGDQI